MQLESSITCPRCKHVETEAMSTNACMFFYDCKGCGTVLRPKPGDCCVFCSYGDVPCPPAQAARSGEASVALCCASTPASALRISLTRDWVGSVKTYWIAWGLPTALLAASLLASVPVRAALWTGALAWMGTACLLNSRRCGRTHCRYTGPYYLAMIVPVALLATGTVPAGFYGWFTLGVFIVLGSKFIWLVTERAWGAYAKRPEGGKA